MSKKPMSEKREKEIQPIKEPNSFYERLLLMKESDPKSFDVMSPATKLSLLHYEAGRREHERLETLKVEKKQHLAE